MSIRKIIDWAIQDQKLSMQGKIVGDFHQLQDVSGNWVWACDVQIGAGETVNLRSVPIASSNLDNIYAEQGKGITLSRMGMAKWSVSGLSKSVTDSVHTVLVSFVDDFWEITGSVMFGNIIRPITYGELGTLIAGSGYGVLPYGAQAKFDYFGTLIELMLEN